MVKPVTPNDLQKQRNLGKHIPDKVVGIINNMVSEAWDGRESTFTQDDLVARIARGMGVTRETVFAKKWLDFEPLFESAGWKVEYDKPGYNESYPASFKLTKKRTTR